MNWYIMALKKYATFSGRARRKEFWYFFLINMLVGFSLAFADQLMGNLNPETGRGLLSGIYTLFMFIPYIAVGVRRLHDTNRSGWWMLIVLIPIIGIIALLIFMALDSDSDSNQYGASPKSLA
ncbi:DUF805 domain-containing protein [Vibrio gallicus]|uniref:DUF805 domain-containing protein n=1 Tax=Vibrio gallicus TaxID=190897 RepID=UPI0021C3C2C2|nr:DUF805 domain-containing protein [Vibrio gallicus]